VSKVSAVELSSEVARSQLLPNNFELIIADGTRFDVPVGTINVAYSMNLVEHLHPDDLKGHLRNVYQALAPNGVYICLTPHRLTGPHDASMHFDEIATGLHLKEYTYDELQDAFRAVGFSRIGAIALRPIYLILPSKIFVVLEKAMFELPKAIRIMIRRTPLLMWLTQIKLIAIK